MNEFIIILAVVLELGLIYLASCGVEYLKVKRQTSRAFFAFMKTKKETVTKFIDLPEEWVNEFKVLEAKNNQVSDSVRAWWKKVKEVYDYNNMIVNTETGKLEILE